MTRSNYDKQKLIEFLRETPNMRLACRKIGLGRATFNRWRKDNYEFRVEVNKALSIGRESLGDLAESVVIKKIHEGDMGAAKYYLSNNHDRYKPLSKVLAELRFEKFIHDYVGNMSNNIEDDIDKLDELRSSGLLDTRPKDQTKTESKEEKEARLNRVLQAMEDSMKERDGIWKKVKGQK